MQLTQQQDIVLKKIKAFLNGDSAVFILRGYAGTGKTTMIKALVDSLEPTTNVVLMAPTGRAAHVLNDKIGKEDKEASTIHKAIYGKACMTATKVKDIANSEFKYIFPVKSGYDGKLVCIIDEASMLSSKKSEHELFVFGTDNLMDDLLTFARPSFGGKLIFVGDPAQLPPVGEPVSNALNADFFRAKGLKVEETELTEVLRQQGDSLILKNAMMIRDLLDEDKRNHLAFEEKAGDVETIKPEELLSKFLESRHRSEGHDSGSEESEESNSIIICYSNKSVNKYNQEIREALYGYNAPLQVNDILLIVQNNYRLDRMNGEFVSVLGIGERIQQSAPVYVENNGERKRTTITLDFQQVTLSDSEGRAMPCMLLEDLLTSDSASISIDESRALYINFCMRHPGLEQGSEEFSAALMADEYYNAVRAKYGYAVTGHKCQGGEWRTVFVDYTGRTGLSDDCLRWAYTTTTRAQQTLYVSNLPHITPFSKFRIDPIQKCKNIDPECRITDDVPGTPFHDLQTDTFLRAKYHCIVRNMEGTPYRVSSVQSRPYMEIYQIQTPDGTERFDLRYKAGGIFQPAAPGGSTAHTAQIKPLLDDERTWPYVFDYRPSDETHEKLFHLIESACDGLSIQMTNVVEHAEDYSVDFYLRTCGQFSYIKIYINGDGFVTYAKPMSMAGTDDSELKALIYEISNNFTK